MRNFAVRHVAIAGAGISGLMSALALNRHGIRSTILERDPAPDESITPRNSWDWMRKGVPQSVHPHFFMGRLRVHLEEFHPELLEALFAAGAGESTMSDYVHPKLAHRLTPKISDTRLRTLNCRRTTFEMVVRQHCESLEDIRIVSEAHVKDFLFDDSQSNLVRGLIYESNKKSETLDADVVIDASGRSSKLAQILESNGIALDVDQRDSGLFYFTRHYQLKSGSNYPKFTGLPGARFPEFTSGAFPADNDHLTVTLQVFSKDKPLVYAIRDPNHFQSVCNKTSSVAKWVDPDHMEATSKVYGFGQMDSFWRKTVSKGQAQVLNHFFVGDSCIRSNPRYGRGCTWSTLAAHDLAALIAQDISPESRTVRYELCLDERFRKDWQTMRDMDRTSEREFEIAVGLTKPTITDKIKQYFGILVEDALVLEPAFLREIWTGYNGLRNMDVWLRNPINFLRLARAWIQRRKLRPILEVQRGRLPHADMVNTDTTQSQQHA